jgi:hypothetical protein
MKTRMLAARKISRLSLLTQYACAQGVAKGGIICMEAMTTCGNCACTPNDVASKQRSHFKVTGFKAYPIALRAYGQAVLPCLRQVPLLLLHTAAWFCCSKPQGRASASLLRQANKQNTILQLYCFANEACYCSAEALVRYVVAVCSAASTRRLPALLHRLGS